MVNENLKRWIKCSKWINSERKVLHFHRMAWRLPQSVYMWQEGSWKLELFSQHWGFYQLKGNIEVDVSLSEVDAAPSSPYLLIYFTKYGKWKGKFTENWRAPQRKGTQTHSFISFDTTFGRYVIMVFLQYIIVFFFFQQWWVVKKLKRDYFKMHNLNFSLHNDISMGFD